MADNGRLYYGFTEEFAHRMGGLCGIADIALPNITEACFMTDTPYDGGPKDQAYVEALLDKVSGLGAKCVVLKGISFEPDRLGVAVRQEGKTSYYFHEKMPRSFHGTGDCYAAAFTGALMQGNSVCEAAGAAADFIVDNAKEGKPAAKKSAKKAKEAKEADNVDNAGDTAENAEE